MRRFKQQKDTAVNGLKASIRVGDVDEDLIPLLEKINALEDYYTTSSCAGRISLLHDLGGKGFNRFLGKWHRTVTPEEVLGELKADKGVVWFMYEPPILHVAAGTIGAADDFIKTVREAGFKHSGIQSVKESRIVIEIMDTERIDAPVMVQGRMLVPEEYVKFLVETANAKLSRSRKKVARLEKML
ncbi:MAG: hypothetical protein NTU61_05930 [Candidatus Altiarchaeota archaeon]|nr:hypothetical protein [Candidatus Altiarchaeota archaeon]